MTEFKTQSEGAVILTKPACVYAYEANLNHANWLRLAEWRKRKGKKMKSPYNWYEKGRNKIILNDKFLAAREFMAANNITLRKWT